MARGGGDGSAGLRHELSAAERGDSAARGGSVCDAVWGLDGRGGAADYTCGAADDVAGGAVGSSRRCSEGHLCNGRDGDMRRHIVVFIGDDE